MSPLILQFPGQSSRDPTVIERLLGARPHLAGVVEAASSTLGRDLRAHYVASNPAIFATNRDVQVGVFLANQLFAELLAQHEVEAVASLGLSLGEYSHLVHIGAIDFLGALRLVDRRGELYDQGPAGHMVAVFPLPFEVAERTAAELGGGRVSVAIESSPTQQVLAGPRADMARVLEAIDAEHFVEAVEIEPRIPMHTPVFAPVERALRPVLEAAPLRAPRLDYLPNVDAEPHADPTRAVIVDALARHVTHPVRWRASIERVAALHPGATFLEVGPRAVLSNLFRGAWRPGEALRMDAPTDLCGHLDALLERLAR